MQVDPKKSREAHSQTGRLTLTAASSLSQQDSLSPCDPRGPQPVPCRGDGAGQPVQRFIDPKLNRIFLAPHPRFDGPARHLIIDNGPSLRARIAGIPPRVIFEAEDDGLGHDHPQARLLVYALGIAVLIIGVAALFA